MTSDKEYTFCKNGGLERQRPAPRYRIAVSVVCAGFAHE